MNIDLISNSPGDHYSKIIKYWLARYGIGYNEIYIQDLGPEEVAELKTDLCGVYLRGPTIRLNDRVFSFLEVSRRPRLVCEEVLCRFKSDVK
jgi:hypothetical protein